MKICSPTEMAVESWGFPVCRVALQKAGKGTLRTLPFPWASFEALVSLGTGLAPGSPRLRQPPGSWKMADWVADSVLRHLLDKGAF